MMISKYAVRMARTLPARADEIALLNRAMQTGEIVMLPHAGHEGELQFMSGPEFVARFNAFERGHRLPVARRVA